MTSITLRMDDELAHEIHKLTKSLKKPKSEVIRECVRAFVHSLKASPAQKAYDIYNGFYEDIPKLNTRSSSQKEKFLTYLRKKKSQGRL